MRVLAHLTQQKFLPLRLLPTNSTPAIFDISFNDQVTQHASDSISLKNNMYIYYNYKGHYKNLYSIDTKIGQIVLKN